MKIYLVNDNGSIETKESLIYPENEMIEVTGLDPIVKQNVLELIQRSRIGVQKYGTSLAENSSDDFLQHAKEEAMDFINYLEKLKETRK